MNVRHVNRATTAPNRSAKAGQPAYASKSVARAAADRRRYGRDDRAEVTDAATRNRRAA